MADVIELRLGQEPSKHERYAMVLVSAQPPVEGAPSTSGFGKRTFYSCDNPTDFACALARAKTWANENLIARVYVRRSLN